MSNESRYRIIVRIVLAGLIALLLWAMSSCAHLRPIAVFEYQHVIYADSTESVSMYKHNYKKDTVVIVGRNAPEK